jgi:hypothetical protein
LSTDTNLVFEATANRNLTANFEVTNKSETAQSASIQMYPNPTKGKITVQGERLNCVEVFDLRGTKLIELKASSDYITMDVSGLSTGCYLVKIHSDQGIIIKKLMLY